MALHMSPDVMPSATVLRGKDRSSDLIGRGKSNNRKNLTTKQLRYQSRKLAGLCCYGRCSAKAKEGATFCQRHLRRMVRQVSGLYKRRITQKLCFRCGLRPQFWGKRCVICRQLVAQDPLPRGARQALREYRQSEEHCAADERREGVRRAAQELLTKTDITERQKEALRLCFGIDDKAWRTHRQVAQLMGVSPERVRQLLLPSKAALAQAFMGNTPWRSAKHSRQRRFARKLLRMGNLSSTCEHRKTQVLTDSSTSYKPIDLPNVILQGVPIFRCGQCGIEQYQVPRQQELHKILARALLSKSSSLSGQEIRFLRNVAGMSVAQFAKRLEITSQTLTKWENRSALTLVNEIATRIVISSLIEDFDPPLQILALPEMIRKSDSASSTIIIEWLQESDCWRLVKVETS